MNESKLCLRVALIEDNAELRALLIDMLMEIPGIEIVACAETESAAIDVLRSQRPDLAIVDLELSEGGSGLNVLKSRGEKDAGLQAVKAVVFSNYSNPVIRDKCQSLGATAFFDKSFQMDDLLDFLHAEAVSKATRGGGRPAMNA